MDGTARDMWDYVSRLESFDYAARAYRACHGLRVDPGKVRQINAAFAQGRMYFESAAGAADGVKPVLLYYGAMSLALGLVLFRRDRKTEESLPRSHGLVPREWPETLEAGGAAAVLDLAVGSRPGTFEDLVDAARHLHFAQAFRGDRSNPDVTGELVDLGPGRFAGDGSSRLTLGDVLARSRYTGDVFPDIAQRPARLHPARVWRSGTAFYFDLRGPDPPEWLRGGPRFAPDDAALPVFHLAGPRAMAVAEHFPNGDRPTEFVKLYVVSYVLGMLARYYPSRWTALLRNEEGWGAGPLLARAARAVETAFVREFAPQVAFLTDDADFFGPAFAVRARRMPDWRRGAWTGSGRLPGGARRPARGDPDRPL